MMNLPLPEHSGFERYSLRLAPPPERSGGGEARAALDAEATLRLLAPLLGEGGAQACRGWLAGVLAQGGTSWHGVMAESGPAWLSLTVLEEADQTRHLLLTLDRARAETSREAWLAASRLDAMITTAGALCHTVNNALTALLGNAEMLLDTEGLPEDAQASARLILRAGERLDVLTSRALRLGRARRPGPGRCDPGTHLARLAVASRRGESGSAQLEATLSPHLGALLVDPGMFEEAVAHLLRNAMTAAGPAGHVQLHASLEDAPAWPGFAWLRVSVADDGPGLPPGELAFPGAGFLPAARPGNLHPIGLACVRAFATALGGSLQAAAGPGGQGALLTLRLPVLDAPA